MCRAHGGGRLVPCAHLIEEGIKIEYPYHFGLPLSNSDFVTIWLEFDLLIRTIVPDTFNIYSTSTLVKYYNQNLFVDFHPKKIFIKLFI